MAAVAQLGSAQITLNQEQSQATRSTKLRTQNSFVILSGSVLLLDGEVEGPCGSPAAPNTLDRTQVFSTPLRFDRDGSAASPNVAALLLSNFDEPVFPLPVCTQVRHRL
jgi:hypothetical protein